MDWDEPIIEEVADGAEDESETLIKEVSEPPKPISQPSSPLKPASKPNRGLQLQWSDKDDKLSQRPLANEQFHFWEWHLKGITPDRQIQTELAPLAVSLEK